VVQAGAVGRLSTDPLGTMGTFSTFQNSTTDAYTDKSFNSNPTNRWGDFTYTSLDPCDDMTMWTTQEYVAGPDFSGVPIDWGVAAEKLLAPPPATPSAASPSSVSTGQSNVSVVITGTSTNGSGFYDTPSTITEPCRKRISASVSGGVTVNSVTYTDPTHVTLNISTTGATTGLQTVTMMNPDGQSSAAGVLTIGASLSVSPSTVNPGSTLTASWSGIATPTAGDWIGLYAVGTSDSSGALSFRYTNGAASGSMQYVLAVGPGQYELRLFANNSLNRLAVSGSIAVQGATVSASPSTVNPGGAVTATWSGILTPTSGDWIGLYAVGTSDSSGALSLQYTNGAASGSLQFHIPASLAPGEYELRLFYNNTLSRLATTGSITVN
jgi:hypothetical protein